MNDERIPTGLLQFDKFLHGGIPKGRPIEIVGLPGTGKTLLWCV